ncbi:EAL domain-containing protein [Legionella waltersii]|uniref:Regulatory protein (GGDEF domain) n=1 Tax=Legionella waltersii TaxID=66969 RepID=A0A0W1A0A0_9GAMM|nr:EAL domain-containing protein [Legionella waltersii]KTD74726.1 regulatory protein (GGDEF domain) [Legionella waltersii]SNV00100.1 regulatory protein (GGDEF domain) [Legionella waltersii]
MNGLDLRIMIIDDNIAIQEDFIKVLTTSNISNELQEMEKFLFEDSETISTNTNDAQGSYLLPKFIFETASQGREGIDKIKQGMENGERYALAFVDIRMPPGWDGIKTIKQMWEIDPDIQVVICTAYSDYSWESTVKHLGMGDNFLILKKPFDLVAVRQLACALTKKWVLAKESKRHTEALQELVHEKTQSLKQSVALLRSTIESSTDGILVVDLNQKIIDFNNKFVSFWNIPNEIMESRDANKLFTYLLTQIVQSTQFLEQLNHQNDDVDQLIKTNLYQISGEIYECSSQPHRMNGSIVGRIWNFRNITEQANLEKRLEHQASHDQLTGLPNRVLLIDRIEYQIEMTKRSQHFFAVLFFDLDRFKLINDSLSHKAGDELLKAVVKRLSTVIRKEDTIARLGGDEFVMLIPQLKQEEDSIFLVHKLLDAFTQPFKIANRELNITTSIGISLFPKDGKTVNQLLKKADLAMYRSKELGGNQFHFYTKELNEQANIRFKIESELRLALKRKEFILYYQPQFEINQTHLLAIEALIRWKHPQRGLLYPVDFIQIAEESGLIIPIGEWVICEVCRQINEWKAKNIPLARVSINVSTQQLKQTNFAKNLQTILKEYGVEPSLIELEITENVVITHYEIIDMINELKSIGVNIVLDDFGAGNSSLNYLKKIHIDRLKIDQSYIQNISSSRPDEVIIEAIIAMAKSFNFSVLAEGVETKTQMNFLKKQQCHEVQGFLLSKPLDAHQLEQFLLKRTKRPRSSPN